MRDWIDAPIAVVAAGMVVGLPGISAAETIKTTMSDQAGRYLTDSGGRALYTFSADKNGAEANSACTDACLTAWPALTADDALEASGDVNANLLTSFQRDDGTRQAAYAGKPLYYFVGDKGRGEATGGGVQQFGGTWHLAQLDTGPSPVPDKVSQVRQSFADLDLQSPECVRLDAERGRYLVSNINGKMTEADGNGFISIVDPDGPSVLKWIAGGEGPVILNAPKGMEIATGMLLVADIDHLRTFDIETGAPMGAVAIDGARFLNDMAVAGDGTVFITDTGTKSIPGAVYRIDPDGNVEKIASGRELARPNGIDFDPDGNLVVVTYAADRVMTMSRDGEILNEKQLDAGKLDGLVVLDDGTKLVSSWDGEHVVRIAPDGTVSTILTGVVQPAAFDVDPEKGLLLVPQVKENAVAVVPLPSGENTSATNQ